MEPRDPRLTPSAPAAGAADPQGEASPDHPDEHAAGRGGNGHRDGQGAIAAQPDTPRLQPLAGSGVFAGESDEILAGRASRGDERAFDEIVGRYQRVIFNLALRMTGHREDSRDLTQEVFVKAWRGLGGFDPGRRFFSWIYRIAIHQCLNHRRRSGRVVELAREPETTEAGPEGRTEAHEMEEALHRALDRLADGDRELVVLRHFLERSYEEIAGILGIPAQRVKSRLYTARQRLRAELERMGVGF